MRVLLRRNERKKRVCNLSARLLRLSIAVLHTIERERERETKGKPETPKPGHEDNGREIERGRRGEKREAERKALHDVFLRLAAGRRKLF